MSTSRSSRMKVLGLSLVFIGSPKARPSSHLRLSSPRTRGPSNHRPAFAAPWVPACAGTTVEIVAALSSPTPERPRQLLGEIFQHAEERVGRRLAQAADRGVAH